jgi:hypothetical protein
MHEDDVRAGCEPNARARLTPVADGDVRDVRAMCAVVALAVLQPRFARYDARNPSA